jgi:hypothetical protein
MAHTTFALLCVGSLLAWDGVVVIRCDHPASPFAPPAPPIVVPRIQTWGSRPSRRTWPKKEPNLPISIRLHLRRAVRENRSIKLRPPRGELEGISTGRLRRLARHKRTPERHAEQEGARIH